MSIKLDFVQDMLRNAVKCENAGRILEAQTYYQYGASKLISHLRKSTSSQCKKLYPKLLYMRLINDYLNRAWNINESINNLDGKGKVVKSYHINYGETGCSYNKLFGKYLQPNVEEMLMEEPELLNKNHFQNLIIFLELVVRKCSRLRFIRLATKTCNENPSLQSSFLQQIASDMSRRNISFNVLYVDEVKPKIVLSSGIIIYSDKGLNYFEPTQMDQTYFIGSNDYDFRRCQKNEIQIVRSKRFLTINSSQIRKKSFFL